VAFQTAYLKANYPAEYMAAVLSRNRSDINKLSTFMDECKAMKIQVKGPDINESVNDFGVNSNGDIRFGLAAIKGVGDNVVAAILAVRKEGGPFKDPYDFAERVPGQYVNRRTLESLVLAGAFDCFPEIKREDYFEKNNRDESFSELLLRYGQLFQQAQQDRTASLFGDMDQELNTAGRPPVRSASPWVDAVKLEKERELVGMFLSAHPLDTYYMELNYGMNTIKERLEAPIEEGRELTFGGMVTRFESRAARNGGNFGIMAVEDYSGSCEVRLFGKKYIEFANYGKPGTPVAITVRGARRFNGDLDWEVVRMNLLDELKGKLIKGVTLTLAADEIKPTLGAVLQEHISSGDGRGGGHLAVKIFDQESNRTIRMESAYRIPMDKNLVNSLNSMDVQFTFDRY